MFKIIQIVSIMAITTAASAVANPNSLNVSLATPNSKPFEYSVNIVGNFNQWSMDENSAMDWNDAEKKYQFSIPKTANPIHFNLYKKGNWQNPLATEFGKPFTCGFVADKETTSTIDINFNGWAKDNSIVATDTAGSQLVTINDFSMKALNRTGDVYIYLPNEYSEQQDKYYPVIYMLDGQNLFSEKLSYSYEWRVDEILTSTSMDVIVIGIANGSERWKEYNPWDSVNYMGKSFEGQGEKTIQFIADELKPYIDLNFRTLKNAENTVLIGSSLGGLMALYAATEHDKTFGKVAAFSPSFSFSSAEAQASLDSEQSNLINAVKIAKANSNSKIYFDVGEIEYGSFDLIDELYNSFLYAGYDKQQLRLIKDKLGRHCELDWSKRLPAALDWLLDVE